jgi:FSR family fosmidomycin resistance protein-like MFS transporter
MGGRIVREPPGDIRAAFGRHRRVLLVLVFAVVFQAAGIVGFVTFHPTVATDRGQSLVEAGFGLALFQAGGAGGSLLGGWLSDRIGRRGVLLASSVLGVPTLIAAILAGAHPVHLPLLALAGALLMASGSVQMVTIQELLPENRSLAAGVMFFVGIGAASLASIAVGVLGDALGLEQAVLLGAAAGLLAVPFILLLPDGRRRQQRASGATP